MTDDYCPYCNSVGALEMTDEHIVPQSIGGDSRTVIRVCKTCNNTIGCVVDTFLSSDSWMRINALFVGGLANRHDRLESTTTLKDGRRLEGHFFFTTDDNKVRINFVPKKHQPDGTIWLSDEVQFDYSTLPHNINLFRREMVEYWGIDCPPPRMSGAEPAMLKILLGMMYLDQGKSIVSSSAFDAIRSSLTGTIHADIQFAWLDKQMRWGDRTIRNHEHGVYFESAKAQELHAGVALFGTGIQFRIHPFKVAVPKRCICWDGRPGPSE